MTIVDLFKNEREKKNQQNLSLSPPIFFPLSLLEQISITVNQ